MVRTQYAPRQEVVPVLLRIDGWKARTAASILALALCGCRGAGGTRSTDNSPVRSYAAISDRPERSVAGKDPDGAKTISSRVDAQAKAGKSASGLTGHVVDTDGTPVANARIRIAFDGATGSREVRGVTDRTGTFRLTGLRADQSYTLIAEWEDAEELLVGRKKISGSARTAEIEVSDPQVTGRRPTIESASKPFIRDLRPEPLLIEAESQRRDDDVAAVRAQSPDESADPAPRLVWRAATADALLKERQAAHQAEVEREAVDPAELDDQGATENPLPPALDRVDTSELSESSRAIVDPPPIDDSALPQPSSGAIDPSGRVFAVPDLPTPRSNEVDSAKTPDSTATPEPAPLALDEPTDPIVAQEVDEPAATPEIVEPEVVAPTDPLPADPFVAPAPADLLEQGESVEQVQTPLTWNDLPPPGEFGVSDDAVDSHTPSTSESGGKLALVDLRSKLLKPWVGSQVAVNCRFDAERQRLSDFTLPDLQGRPFQRSDADADFLLLAFWGSWSDSCLQAVGHLDDLQQHFDPARLQVVSIAYEKTDLARRALELESLSRRLGLHFPILLGATDGTCPLQEALNVQYYPTFILIDRYGRIQWRAAGTTNETFVRLDRAVNSAVQRSMEVSTAQKPNSEDGPTTAVR